MREKGQNDHNDLKDNNDRKTLSVVHYVLKVLGVVMVVFFLSFKRHLQNSNSLLQRHGIAVLKEVYFFPSV
jgi:hypothetical protein